VIRPQVILASKALDQIEAILREQGISLEELIEAGRDGRDELVREQYGIEPAAQPDWIFIDASVLFAAARSDTGSARDLILAGARGNLPSFSAPS
jgi:hypothetical protein